MTLKPYLLSSVALVSAITFLPGAALAQDTGAVDLGEIALQSMRSLDVEGAAARTTLDQEELDSRQASTVAEALGTIPGVTLSNAATPQGSSINIRGLGADAGTYGSNTKVSIVIDGVKKGQEEIYRQGNLLSIEPELFKQVSVIRGPGESFRWASGAIGGTIEAQTKDAADFLEGDDTFAFRQKLAFKGGAKKEFTTTSILAWRPDDRLDLIAFFGKRTAEDYSDGDGNEQADTAYELPSGLIKLKYQLTPDLSATASYAKSTNRLSDVSYDLIGSLFSARVDADLVDETAYVALNYAPAGNNLVNLTAKFTYSNEVISNISDTVSSTIYNAEQTTETKAFILENEALFSTGAADHKLLAGIEVGERKRSSLSTRTAPTAPGPSNCVTFDGFNDSAAPGGTDKYVSVYISDQIKLGGLTATPQLRYERQTITGSEDNVHFPVLNFGDPRPFWYYAVNPLATNGESYTKSSWTGALSLKYDFANGFGVFGTAAYNENLPIIDDLSDSSAPFRYETSEKARTYEAGLSYSNIGVLNKEDSLDAKLTAFRTNIWDNTTYFNRNSDKIGIEGLELELSYAHPQFYMDLNASRIRAKWDDGTWFENAPADNVQLTLGKRFLDNQLDLNYEVVRYSPTKRNNSGTEWPVEVIHSMGATYKPDSGALSGMDIRFGIDNLTDETYTPYLSSRPGPGRTFKLSVAKTF